LARTWFFPVHWSLFLYFAIFMSSKPDPTSLPTKRHLPPKSPLNIVSAKMKFVANWFVWSYKFSNDRKANIKPDEKTGLRQKVMERWESHLKLDCLSSSSWGCDRFWFKFRLERSFLKRIIGKNSNFSFKPLNNMEVWISRTICI
jgi:hypothetical protein